MYLTEKEMFNMEKKKRDVSLPKRFNSEDIKKWQEQASA